MRGRRGPAAEPHAAAVPAHAAPGPAGQRPRRGSGRAARRGRPVRGAAGAGEHGVPSPRGHSRRTSRGRGVWVSPPPTGGLQQSSRRAFSELRGKSGWKPLPGPRAALRGGWWSMGGHRAAGTRSGGPLCLAEGVYQTTLPGFIHSSAWQFV